ncbi:E3 ubiquitin-protein ligase RHA2A-like [Nymphaea colorata]|nr:E3 ubiquitin-protein ligase RHA2A-like [Nymphaea colorata]
MNTHTQLTYSYPQKRERERERERRGRQREMGICGGIKDGASDSIPIFIVVTAACWISYLRSLLFLLLNSLGFLHLGPHECCEDESDLGLGLARIIVLAEGLEKNSSSEHGFDGGDDQKKCAVCMCRLKEGEEVRKLGCSHVFHRSCLDGWFGFLNLNCPLCRAPLMGEECVRAREKEVSHELHSWFF